MRVNLDKDKGRGKNIYLEKFLAAAATVAATQRTFLIFECNNVAASLLT